MACRGCAERRKAIVQAVKQFLPPFTRSEHERALRTLKRIAASRKRANESRANRRSG
jgi:hypothetical protein